MLHVCVQEVFQISFLQMVELAGLEPASRGFPGPHSTLELQFHLNTLVMPTGVEPIFPA